MCDHRLLGGDSVPRPDGFQDGSVVYHFSQPITLGPQNTLVQENPQGVVIHVDQLRHDFTQNWVSAMTRKGRMKGEGQLQKGWEGNWIVSGLLGAAYEPIQV